MCPGTYNSNLGNSYTRNRKSKRIFDFLFLTYEFQKLDLEVPRCSAAGTLCQRQCQQQCQGRGRSQRLAPDVTLNGRSLTSPSHDALALAAHELPQHQHANCNVAR